MLPKNPFLKASNPFLKVLPWLSMACCLAVSPAAACGSHVRVLIPIPFAEGSSTISAIGEKAAADLVTALERDRPDKITLIGHADDPGGEQVNMELSRQRADAVAQLLKRSGITAEISTVAKGSSEPRKLVQKDNLTSDEIKYLNRRVEWKSDSGHELSLRAINTRATRCGSDEDPLDRY